MDMKKIFVWPLLFLSIVLLSSFNETKTINNEGLAIIVNKDNPVTRLSVSEAKLYYLRKIKKRWPQLNKNIRPADRKRKCSERDAFYQNVLGMTDNEVEQYFVNKQIQNAERPQDKFSSEEEMIDFVADEPGAIGYIKASSITPEVRAKIKIVLTL